MLLLSTLPMQKRFERLGTAFCFDTETSMWTSACGGWKDVRLLQFANDEGAEFYLDTLELGTGELLCIREYLERPDLEITMQNGVFDYRVMRSCGIYLGGRPTPDHLPTFYDTMLASQILYAGMASVKHDLGSIVKRELNVDLDKSLQKNNWMEAQLTEEELTYAMDDVRYTLQASHVLHEKIEAQKLRDTYALECALVPAVVEMESTGMRLDPDAINETIRYYEKETKACRQLFLEVLDSRLLDENYEGLPRDPDGSFNTRIKDSGDLRKGTKVYAGFNMSAPKQVLSYFNKLGIEPVDDTGKPSTRKEVLARFQSDELVRLLCNFKKVEKRCGMAQKLCEHTDVDHRIRARFMQMGAGTGRWSSSGPNLQQIPRDPEFRCAFKAPPGRLIVEADFSAMELRIAAALAGEQKMLDAFNAGRDVHRDTAALMYNVEPDDVTSKQRTASKSCSFGLLYGSGARGLMNYFATVGLFITLVQAAEFSEMWHSAYPAFGKWHKQCQAKADAGDHMRTLIGRRRYLLGDENKLTVQANNVVQGTGADVAKAALVEIHRKLPSTARLIATVHDSYLVEADEADAEGVLTLMLREMEDAGRSILGDAVLLTGEGGYGPSWGECK